MLRSTTTLLTLCCLALPAQAIKSNMKIFGSTDISYTHEFDDDKNSEIKNNESTIGLKGYLRLSPSFKAFYRSEWQITDKNFKLSSLSAKTNYLGVNTSMGNLALGHNESLLQRLFAPLDLFYKYTGSVENLWTGGEEIKHSISYYSPDIKGATIALMHSPKEEYSSTSLQWGDNKLKSSNTFGSYTFTKQKNTTIHRISIAKKIGKTTFTLAGHQQDDQNTKLTGWLAGAKYPVSNVTLKGQYQTLENNNALSFGVDVSINRSLQLYAWHTKSKHQQNKSNALSIGVAYTF